MLRNFALLSLAFVLTACATTPPSVGDKMRDQGLEAKELGEQWNEGTNLIAKAKKLKSQAEKQIENGEEDLRKSDSMLQTGQKLVLNSEKAFQERFPGQSIQ